MKRTSGKFHFLEILLGALFLFSQEALCVDPTPVCKKKLTDAYSWCYQGGLSTTCASYTTYDGCNLVFDAPSICDSAALTNGCDTNLSQMTGSGALKYPKTTTTTTTTKTSSLTSTPANSTSPMSTQDALNALAQSASNTGFIDPNSQQVKNVFDSLNKTPPDSSTNTGSRASNADPTPTPTPTPTPAQEKTAAADPVPSPPVQKPPTADQIEMQQALADAELMKKNLSQLNQNHAEVVAQLNDNPGSDLSGINKLYDNLGLSNGAVESLKKKRFSEVTGEISANSEDNEYEYRNGIKFKKKKKNSLVKNGTGSDISTETDAASYSTSKKGKYSNNAWLDYMASGSSRDQFVTRLSKDPSLREKLKKMLEEKKRALGEEEQESKGAETIAFLEDALKDAEVRSQDKSMDDLKPMSAEEAFAMDSDETRRAIDGMLNEMDDGHDGANSRALASVMPGSEQFYAQGTLFERVKLAYGRTSPRLNKKH